MVVISARFISLFLTALTAGVVLGHVISRAGKMTFGFTRLGVVSFFPQATFLMAAGGSS